LQDLDLQLLGKYIELSYDSILFLNYLSLFTEFVLIRWIQFVLNNCFEHLVCIRILCFQAYKIIIVFDYAYIFYKEILLVYEYKQSSCSDSILSYFAYDCTCHFSLYILVFSLCLYIELYIGIKIYFALDINVYVKSIIWFDSAYIFFNVHNTPYWLALLKSILTMCYI